MNDRRYQNDPVFHTLVDTFYAYMRDGVFTPTDVREALLVASIRFEDRRNMEPRFVPIRETEK